MVELHPEILEKSGQGKFAVLPYAEFEALRELLLDYEDLRDLREAQAEEASAPTMSLREAAQRYNVKSN